MSEKEDALMRLLANLAVNGANVKLMQGNMSEIRIDIRDTDSNTLDFFIRREYGIEDE